MPFITEDKNNATNYTNYRIVPIYNILTNMHPTYANEVKQKIIEFNSKPGNANIVYETTIPLNATITLNSITQVLEDTSDKIICNRLFILNNQLAKGTNNITIRIMIIPSNNTYRQTKCHGADEHSVPESKPKSADNPATLDTGSTIITIHLLQVNSNLYRCINTFLTSKTFNNYFFLIT